MREEDRLPFPDVAVAPSELALILQKRIKYMFDIDVEPVIYRRRASYNPKRGLAYKWGMRTQDGRYEIVCFENARVMAEKDAWGVLEGMLAYVDTPLVTGKVIY